MKHSRGFTIVEIIVTVTIMVILMAVAVVGLRSTQANARDQERKSDVEAIARGFEERYRTGGNNVEAGAYPGGGQFWDGPAWGGAYTWESYAPGTTKETFTSPTPNSYGLQLICLFGNPSPYWGLTPGCETTGNEAKIKEWLTSSGKYGYEPLYRGGGLCYHNCASFTLYWISEVDGELKKYKSKNR